jgi:para-aminobenzoate synthetase component 1
MSLLVRGQNTPLHLRKLPYDPGAVRGFAPLATEPGAVLLESALRHPRFGRHAFWAARPFAILEAGPAGAELRRGGRVVHRDPDPFRLLADLLREFAQLGSDLPTPFAGGLVGCFGYDLGRRLERLPERAKKDDRFPDLWLGLYDAVVCVDHAAEAVTLSGREGCDDRSAIDDRMAALAETYWTGLDASRGEGENGRRGEWETSPLGEKGGKGELRSNFTRDSYLAAVARAKEHIARGDIYQVNLSQRFETTCDLPPFELYRRLRAASPAPFAAFLNLGDGRAVLSASPERFLRLDGRRVETRPIKGTRPRGASPEEDARLRAELVASEKDRAELVMIVDLERNDLGRVCAPGSVEVAEPRTIETYAQVHHGVASVRGTLRADAGPVDLLRATFPGGSITGAPKVRAMEIIEALEPTRRSVYTGAIGWIGFDGRMDLSIAIRTMLVEGTRATFQAGGGIVADSDPAAEYAETLVKAEGMRKALGNPQIPNPKSQ